MNKRIDFSLPGGFPFHQGVTDFMQSGYKDAITGIANMAGNMVIISGMVEAGGNVTAGWIMLNGEMLPFQAGAKQTTFIVEETAVSVRFLDGADKPVFFTKIARFGSGIEQFQYADLRRISSNSFMLDAETFATSRALKRLAELSVYEETVIVSGCEVSDINAGAQTCTIDAGKVLIGEQYFITEAYAGQYPVWINSSGAYVTVDPGGLSIRFDPHTTQRKADVLRRAITPSGQIIELATGADRFDPVTGLGRWEMLGFRISDEDRGRISIGYDSRAVNPGNGIWDANYNEVGNIGGSKDKLLTMSNLPALIPLKARQWNEGGHGLIASGGNMDEGELNVNWTNPGGGQKFSLMNPYIVRLKAIRI